ncbi:MAG TPA: mercury(II) reductase [Thermoplasmata archaeon]|nr:mercury(II) reductase [Thermoplasmata archaeon]
MAKPYDLVILGGGAAAFSAAIRADRRGAKAVMIDGGTIGGTCVNVGCVPSKRLLAVGDQFSRVANHRFQGLRLADGWSAEFRSIVQAKDRTVASLRKSKYQDVLASLKGVEYVRGRASFVSPHAVKARKDRYEGEKFVIATGSSPTIPPIPGIEDVDYLTNVEALSLRDRPDSMIVVGGRALGLEFAQMYRNLGTQVTVVQRSDRILPEEEPEISAYLARYLREEGVRIHTGAKIVSTRQKRRKKLLEVRVGNRTRHLEADEVLLASGRTPNTDALNLSVAGVAVKEDKGVKVDREMRSTAPHVFAGGDVVGKPMLETAAAREGYIAAENALANRGLKMDYRAVPHAVFTNPAVASVGLTDAEANATESGVRCSCNTVLLEQVPKPVIVEDTRGLVKIVAEAESHKILGVHILASLAPEMIHEGLLAVKYGLTLEDILDTVHVFPTHTEAIKFAALSFFEDVDKLSCCAL